MNNHELSLSILIMRRWRMIGSIVAMFIALAAVITYFLPRKYESEMMFLVGAERADLVLSPQKAPVAGQAPAVTSEQVNSELILLGSRDILAQTARDERLWVPYETGSHSSPSALAIQKAINRLERDIEAKNLPKSDVISVTYRNRNPYVAAAVLQKIGEYYLQAHLGAHGSAGSLKLFEDMAEHARQDLAAARTELTHFHKKTQLFSMPLQQNAAVDGLSQIETSLAATNGELADQRSRLKEMSRQLARTPERSLTQVRRMPNQLLTQQLSVALADLNNKRAELTTKFKDDDRFVRTMDNEIAQTQAAIVKAQQGSSVDETTDIDSVHQALLTDYKKQLSEAEGLQSRRSELVRQRSEYMSRLGSLDRDDLVLQDLEQREKDAQDNYDLQTRHMTEARLADSLDRQRLSNVAQIEAPEAELMPAFPNLYLDLAVGMVLGGFLGLALAYFMETKRQSGTYSTREPELSKMGNPYFAAATGD